MKYCHIDCRAGICGSMLIGAFLDAGLPFHILQAEIAKLGIPGLKLSTQIVVKGGFAGTLFRVEDACLGPQPRRGIRDITRMIEQSTLDAVIQEQAIKAFQTLAEAEAAVHGISSSLVHFHEVGAIDSIVDIVGAIVAKQLLGVDAFVASAVNVGTGLVRTAHGLLSVPAPATAQLLKGMPVSPAFVRGELTTPTGALLLKEWAPLFGGLPAMKVIATGAGAGELDLSFPNLLRITIGESEPDPAFLLECEVDDMSPEDLGALFETLPSQGALDVSMHPVQMKKNRTGIHVGVLVPASRRDEVIRAMFAHTSTIGIRLSKQDRLVLDRKLEPVETSMGVVRCKVVEDLEGKRKCKPEFDDCHRLARQEGIPVGTMRTMARNEWQRKELKT